MRPGARIGILALMAVLARAPRLAAAPAVAYAPAAGLFSCELPGDWSVFEEEELSGLAVHVLGPDGPRGSYRVGIDIHWHESGKTGFVDSKAMLERLRRSDSKTRRSAGPLRRVNTRSGLARTLEARETRRLAAGSGPALEEDLRHMVALLPSGESYFVLRLSAPEEVYLEHRETFLRLLKSFRITGY